ncbi:MAG: hypothetical protein HZC29_00830 [Thaumarchaeota archaeon]|nr:hypothetical protein [Nitrososphaerota archaeon]
MSGKVAPPKIEYVEMKHFPLKDLKDAFVIPEFERRVDRSHMKRMVEAILNNEFYDTVIRGTRLPNKKVQLIDAQHRLLAFTIAHENHGLQHYDFHLLLYTPEDARKIYRRLNMGKKLVAADITLALDDGGVKFFNELRRLAQHYRNEKGMAFTDVLFAWNYCTTKSAHSRMELLEQIMRSLDDKNIALLKNWMQAMHDTAGALIGNPMYLAPVFRNIARVGYERNYTYNEFVDLVRKLQKAKLPDDIERIKSLDAYNVMYTFITNKILKEKLK